MGILEGFLTGRDYSDETSTFRDYEIVIKPEKGGGFRGVAWIPMNQRQPGVSFFTASAPTSARVLDDLKNRVSEHADARKAHTDGELRATLEDRHKDYLAKNKVTWRGWKTPSGLRSATCHGCGSKLKNFDMPVCGACSGIICLKCAACGCGWSMWEKVK